MAIEVRQAVKSDREPLMEFVKKVWGGHDYIPYVWDQWLKEKDSKMFVALADGKQVGMNRVRFLEDGSAWFEGARVHPDFRGKGYATALGETSMRYASEHGAVLFRLTSSSWNRKAHRQISRIGFTEASRISVYSPQKGLKIAAVSGVTEAESLKQVESAITASREFRIGSGVMWDTFAAIGLTEKVIARDLSEGNILTAGGALAISRPGGERSENWRQVCFLTGPEEGAVRLVRHILGRRGRPATQRCFAYLPQGSSLIGALRRAGFERHYSLILFVRGPAKG